MDSTIFSKTTVVCKHREKYVSTLRVWWLLLLWSFWDKLNSPFRTGLSSSFWLLLVLFPYRKVVFQGCPAPFETPLNPSSLSHEISGATFREWETIEAHFRNRMNFKWSFHTSFDNRWSPNCTFQKGLFWWVCLGSFLSDC